MFKSFLSALTAAMLFGCATPSTIQPSTGASKQVSTEEGALAFRLTVSGGGVSHFFTFWTRVIVKNVDPEKNGRTFEVLMSNLGAAGSATYFGALPEGKYQIQSFSSENCGVLCITSGSTFSNSGLSFTVGKGEITYLGNLIYANSNNNQSSLIASPASGHENFQQWLRVYFPSFASLPVREQGLGTERGYRRIQDQTQGYLNGTPTPQGSVLFTNLSGSLRLVTWPASVKSINTGLMSRANTVLPISEKHWLVAGDFGEARESEDGGATWHDANLNLPYGAVRGLYKGKDSELLAFIEQKGILEIYSAPIGGPWSRLSSDTFQRSIMKGGITSPQLIPSHKFNRILVVLPGSPSFLIDTHTYARTEFEFPGAITNASLSEDDVIRCLCNRTGIWVSNFDSRDGGKTWQDSELARVSPLPRFKNKNMGFNTQRANLLRTADGGKTWNKVHEQTRPDWPFPLLPYQFDFIFLGDRRIVATDTLGRLLSSEDDGLSWSDVRQSR